MNIQTRNWKDPLYLDDNLSIEEQNISKTASFIGMERSALHRKLRTLGIKGVN